MRQENDTRRVLRFRFHKRSEVTFRFAPTTQDAVARPAPSGPYGGPVSPAPALEQLGYFRQPKNHDILKGLPQRYRQRLTATPCLLPLKPLICGTIDMAKVLSSSATRHTPYLKTAMAFLDGTSDVWRELFAMPRVEARPSNILPSHVDDLNKYGLVRPLARSEVPLLSRLFLTPKKDGRTSRPLFDARHPVNVALRAVMDERMAPYGPKFRLLDPFHHVAVGVGKDYDGDYHLYAADATSYFPQFPWSPTLARLTAFRTPGGVYGHMSPPQGVNLVPYVAQVTSAALADAPVVTAPRRAWVDSRTSIIYDNWLMGGDPTSLAIRVESFRGRCRDVGVVLGEDSGVVRTVDCAGFQFDKRRWRLLPSWTSKALDYLIPMSEVTGTVTSVDRSVVAGLSLWAVRATLRPWLMVRPLVKYLVEDEPWHSSEREALEKVLRTVRNNAWRRLVSGKGRRRFLYVDASLEAAGWCNGKRGRTYEWDKLRNHTEQQACELEGAALAVEDEMNEALPGDTIYLGIDNTGVQDILVDGFPTAGYAVPLVNRIVYALARGGVRLRIFHVAGLDNPADPWSRPSKGERRCLPPDPRIDEIKSRRAVWSYAADVVADPSTSAWTGERS